jgi:hypothetical protein
MKKVILALILALFVSSFAFAQEDDRLSMNGTIIDCASADVHKDDIAGFLAIYTKNDALKPEAVKSGYGIWLGDQFMKFDKGSKAAIVDFLNKADSSLQVTVQVYIEQSDLLSLISITNK